jgi:hypothetical protein
VEAALDLYARGHHAKVSAMRPHPRARVRAAGRRVPHPGARFPEAESTTRILLLLLAFIITIIVTS